MSKKTTSTTTRTLPAGLPPLPKGYVYLGKGGEFENDEKGGLAGFDLRWSTPEWDTNNWEGGSSIMHYAALADSEIARLNGLAPEPERKVEADAWIPTKRSPWAVIHWSWLDSRWEWHATLYATRATARNATAHMNVETRVVRAWIPLKHCPLPPRKKGGRK